MIYLTLKEISRIARDGLLENGSCQTVLVIEGTERNGVVPLDLDDPGRPRLFQLFSLGRKVGQDKPVGQPVQLYVISEAWMSVARQGKPLPGRPSQDPERVEVLTVYQYRFREQQSAAVLFEVVRGAGGRVVAVKELDGLTNDAAQSPLLAAFLAGYAGAGHADS